MRSARLASLRKESFVRLSLYFANEKQSAAPTIMRKNGNTRSVGVHPLQAACLSGGKIELHVPGLFTSIMPATVIPLRTSSATYLCDTVFILGLSLGVDKIRVFITFVQL